MVTLHTAEELGYTFRGNAGDSLAFVDLSVGIVILTFKHLAPALLATGKLYYEGHLGATDAMPQEIRVRAEGAMSIGRLRRRRQSECMSRIPVLC